MVAGQPLEPLDPKSPPTLFGRPLEPAFRDDMERRFGHDFSSVRVHHDANAQAVARGYGASAFTRGDDIFLADGREETAGPDSGRRMAHELAHVVQQSAAPAGDAGGVRVTQAHDPTEVEADRAALAIAQDRRPVVQSRITTQPVAQRQPAPASGGSGAGAAPTTMSIVSLGDPTDFGCGALAWRVNFVLPSASPAGGYFVQEVTASRTATNCAGAALPAANLFFHYWEAWHVLPGGTTDELNGAAGFSDQYSNAPAGTGSKGVFSVNGSVRYFEGLTLPASFVRNAPQTAAGNLPATTSDPKLAGGTAPVAHNMAGNWACCPPDQSSTIGHNP